MAGLGVRLFLDEMINPRLANRLNRLGYDVESCQAAGRAGLKIPDDQQLVYATQQGRAIYSFNARDFKRLHRAWQANGRSHAGIVYSEEIADLTELIRRIQLHLDTTAPADQYNQALPLKG